MKTLLIGADGLLGSYWLKKFSELYPNAQIKGTSRKFSDDNKFFLELSKNHLGGFQDILEDYRPESVIYLAGITNVDDCEKEKQLSLEMNAEIPAEMATLTYDKGIKFLYISTDHLFGDTGSFFTENEPVVLVNHYATSKRAAESMIIKNNPEALVIRTNFYGKSIANKPSFTDWIEKNLISGSKISMAVDVHFNPVFIGDLVKVSHILLEKKQSGIFNVTSDDRISKYDFALLYGKFFNFNTDCIKPFEQQKFPKEVKRPLEMSLSNKKMNKITGVSIGKTADGFERLRQEIQRSAQ